MLSLMAMRRPDSAPSAPGCSVAQRHAHAFERLAVGRRGRAGIACVRRPLLVRSERLQPLERRHEPQVRGIRRDVRRLDGTAILRGELEQLADGHRDARMLNGIVKPTL
jgi:hypothetical protein